MSDIAQDLGGVVRLLEKATPGPWVKANSYRGIHTEHPSPGPVHVCRAPEHFHDQWELNAPAIAAAVNFLRTHSAEIAGALRDAERLDALERLLESTNDGMILLHNGNGAGRGITGLGLKNTERSLRQAIDDSAMQQGGGGGGWSKEHAADCRIHEDGSVCDCGVLAMPRG